MRLSVASTSIGTPAARAAAESRSLSGGLCGAGTLARSFWLWSPAQLIRYHFLDRLMTSHDQQPDDAFPTILE
jgi:hypothetical protein